MLRRILLTALVAGGLAGLFAAGLHQLKIVPLIAAAEVHETKASADHRHAAEHRHEPAAAWEPASGLERTGYTVVADILAGIGFALILTGAVAIARLCGYPVDARHGLLWGAAGFAVFAFAPAVGLPPELPGMMAAELAERQQWWLLTAAATAAGLALLVFARPIALRGAGIMLLLMPHLIGAPVAQHAGGAVPAELAAEFVTASLATTALFWLVLGGLSGWFYQRFVEAA